MRKKTQSIFCSLQVLPPLVWISPCMDLSISMGSHNMQNHTNLKILGKVKIRIFTGGSGFWTGKVWMWDIYTSADMFLAFFLFDIAYRSLRIVVFNFYFIFWQKLHNYKNHNAESKNIQELKIWSCCAWNREMFIIPLPGFAFTSQSFLWNPRRIHCENYWLRKDFYQKW